MKLNSQKRIAGTVLNCSPKRVRFTQSRLEEIKEAITKVDMKALVEQGAVKSIQKKGVSRGRAKKSALQRKKGRQKGQGSRKGKKNARLSDKNKWIARVRKQRALLRELKEKKLITTPEYSKLYYKSKGGFFRSLRHLKLYITENNLVKRVEKQ